MTDTAFVDDPAELTRYIERHYHVRHRTQLPDLAGMAAKVEQVHAGVPAVPDGLAARLRHLIGALEVHMKKEELNPSSGAIRRGGGPGLGAPIAVIRVDHGSHGDEIACLRDLTKGFTPPEGACGTWQTLYGGLREFVAELEEHIRLENEVLFPRFDH